MSRPRSEAGDPVGARFPVRRLALAYAVLFAGLAVVAIVVFSVGSGEGIRQIPPGPYELRADAAGCLGEPGDELRLEQAGDEVELAGPGDSGGTLRVEDDVLAGEVQCVDGSTSEVELELEAARRTEQALEGTVGAAEVVVAEPETAQRVEARSPEETFGRFMLAVAAVILAARLVGTALGRIGQPVVMGEVLAGILLGPSLLGAIAPEVRDYLFPPDIVPLLRAGAQIGLVFYMFLVGLELDPRVLRGRAGQAAFISNASVVFPLALGIAVAVPLYDVFDPQEDFAPFAIFMGVAMSITAFPVLARILIERRMLRRPVGAIALASAAIDDVTAWGLLALATAIAASGSPTGAVYVILLAAIFSAGLVLIGRRILSRLSNAYDEAGHVPAIWIGGIFVFVLLAAYTSVEIGIAAIFGAFMVGLVMPRRADLTHDVTRRIEDFVVTVLLPLFFVVTGLNVDIGGLTSTDWLLTLLLIAIAIVGKWLGALVAARLGGFNLKESAAIGILMNTRGLTELIVLNIGFELGVITRDLFTMLVIMALVTTFMAGPILRLIDPREELSTPPEDELRGAERAAAAPARGPEHSIVVAPLDAKNLDALLSLAEPLARSEPPREVVLAAPLAPARITTGLAVEDRELEHATAELRLRRELLDARGVGARAVAFLSADRGRDLVRLASAEEVDLVLLDGRRPLLGEGVPRGEVGAVLEHAPSDVAVLVERGTDPPEVDADHAVAVPFGGADHDWAALELAAWIATGRGAPLKLLGAQADIQTGEEDASRLLANASLVVQQLAGIVADPVLVERSREGILRGAAGAGLLVVGLSDRWRSEGLGPMRSEIAKAAPAPLVFVRRGTRPGALAPREDLTRFTWSLAARPSSA
jgi:Kef-type K+ transport system membrane component KefB